MMRLSPRSAIGSFLLTSALLLGCGTPSLTQVLVSRSTLLDSQSTRINVTVHHENGLDELVGAQLYSEDRSFWYGSFAEISDGIFETSVNWGMLHEAQPIQFDFPIERSLLIVVEDNDGETDEVTITLKLQCRADEKACKGACYDDGVDCSDV